MLYFITNKDAIKIAFEKIIKRENKNELYACYYFLLIKDLL